MYNAKHIFFSLLHAALFFAWKFYDNVYAENVFLFYTWFLIFVGIIAGMLGDKTWDDGKEVGKTAKAIGNVKNFALVFAMAAYGMFVTAAFFAVAVVGAKIALKREKKKVGNV